MATDRPEVLGIGIVDENGRVNDLWDLGVGLNVATSKFQCDVQITVDPNPSALPCLEVPRLAVGARFGVKRPECTSVVITWCLRKATFMLPPTDRLKRKDKRRLTTAQLHEFTDCADGDLINAIDSTGDWWTCRIVARAEHPRCVHVHYPGWPIHYDEMCLLDSPAVAPHQVPQSWCLRADQCIEKDFQPILWPIVLVEPFSLNFNSLLRVVYNRYSCYNDWKMCC